MTPIIDCYWVGAGPKIGLVTQALGLRFGVSGGNWDSLLEVTSKASTISQPM